MRSFGNGQCWPQKQRESYSYQNLLSLTRWQAGYVKICIFSHTIICIAGIIATYSRLTFYRLNLLGDSIILNTVKNIKPLFLIAFMPGLLAICLSGAVLADSNTDRCYLSDIDYADNPNLTREERIAAMNAAFLDSINQFEECMLSTNSSGAGGASGTGGSSGGSHSQGLSAGLGSSVTAMACRVKNHPRV